MHAICSTFAVSGILHNFAADGTTTFLHTKALVVQDLSVEAECHYVGSCSAYTIAVHSHACCIHWCRSGTVELNIDGFLLKQSVTVIVNAAAFPCVARALQ